MDNYAAAFLKAGARAVIANGHSHADYYIDALFNTRQSILDYWRHAPDYHGGTAVYASTRSPGYSFAMDPEGTGSYYRAITGKLTLQTKDVTGANYADTSADPSVLAVPGNATPKLDGSPVYGSVANAVAGLDPVATLGTSTRVRVEAKEPVVSIIDASPVYRMHTDDGVEGWMTGVSLLPRDSVAPRVWEVDDGVGTFSPNEDDTQDTYALSIRLSESSAWHLRIVDGDGAVQASAKGTSDTAALTWAPATGRGARRRVPLGPRCIGWMGQRPARCRWHRQGRHRPPRGQRRRRGLGHDADVHAERRWGVGHDRVQR